MEEFSAAKLLGISEEELEKIAPKNPKPSTFKWNLTPSPRTVDASSKRDDKKSKKKR